MWNQAGIQWLIRVPALLMLVLLASSHDSVKSGELSEFLAAEENTGDISEDLDEEALEAELLAADVEATERETPEKARTFTPTEAWKYFRPFWVAYGGMEPEKLRYFSGNRDLREIVKDPKHRLEAFLRPNQALESRVLFWMQIHSLYTTQMRVIHDRENPEIVYGFIDGTEVLNGIESKAVAWTTMYRLEKQAISELKNQLLRAEKDPKLADLYRWMTKVGISSKPELAIGRIRTQTGQRDEFLAALERSRQLLPYIESTFRRQGIPGGLARIPFVESSFNPRAGSKVGAVGMFQFMPETARQMIHPTDRSMWMDPLRQTKAAAKVLRIFRSILPDWSTTATAYNSGVGRLKRLCAKYKAKELGPILEKSTSSELGFAGKNFFTQLVSANLVEAYQDEIFREKIETPRADLAAKPDFLKQLKPTF